MAKKKQVQFGIGQYLKKYKFVIFLYIFLLLVASGFSIFNTLGFAKAIDRVTQGEYIGAIHVGLFVLGSTFLRRLCWYFNNHVYIKYSAKIVSDMNLALAEQSFKLDSKSFKDHDSGTFVMRIVNDPNGILDRLSSIVDSITDIITALIMIIYITTLNFYVTIAIFVTIIIAYTIEYFRIKFRRKHRKIVREEHDKINSLTQEIVRSEQDIKSLGLEEKLSEVSRQRYNSYRNAVKKEGYLNNNFGQSRSFILETASILIIILGITLMSKALITLASFMVIYSNNDRLYNIIWSGSSITNNVIDIKIAHARMSALFDEYEFKTEKFGNINLDEIQGNVEFKNVCYIYRNYEYTLPEKSKTKVSKKNRHKVIKTLIDENPVFTNLSFKIPANKTVAFVGKSGSGKTTILNLMSKMYDADGGQVLIDGVDIKDLSKKTLRNSISLVNQFPYIFDMTIRENLQLAKKDATDEEIWNALKDASLDKFVKELKNQLDTKVGESGIKLSGGQKQRLAIARALLRKSSIILFDESTSSLDNFAQEDVRKSIDKLKGKSTIVIVAHRLSTIKNVDKIFFLDNGKVIDTGTFDELYDKNEYFKSMFLTENISSKKTK